VLRASIEGKESLTKLDDTLKYCDYSAIMWLEKRSDTLPEPFSWSPSQAFEGNDGSWSTFVVRIGEPDQDFHVLISTAGQETWVPVIDGCLPTDPSNCGALRGVLPFNNQYSGGFQVNAVII